MNLTGPQVAIDATAIHAQSGGAGRYVRELVIHLGSNGTSPTLLVGQDDDYSWPGASSIHRVGPSRRPVRLIWEQTRLLKVLTSTAPEVAVLHSPHYTMPRRLSSSRIARVVTIHDATWFSRPGDHVRSKVPLFRQATIAALQRADAVIVPTAAVEVQLRQFVSNIDAPVAVIHHGVDLALFAPPGSADPDADATKSTDAQIRTELGVTGPYIVHLGTIEPRKNVDVLCAAVELAVDRNLLPKDVTLVLAGQAWPGVLASLPPARQVLRLVLGWVSDRAAAALLRGATVVAYPSSEEGFGLPVAEALAAGATVVTSNVGATAEVANGAAHLVTPRDVEALAETLGVAWTAGRLGLAPPSISTWSDSARAHMRVYEDASAAR
jgi:glycosyltransferase involved in cell wall biosynthesis